MGFLRLYLLFMISTTQWCLVNFSSWNCIFFNTIRFLSFKNIFFMIFNFFGINLDLRLDLWIDLSLHKTKKKTAKTRKFCCFIYFYIYYSKIWKTLILQRKRALNSECSYQGYKDSNLEMTESESVALPFGDIPMCFSTASIPWREMYYIPIISEMQALFYFSCKFFSDFSLFPGSQEFSLSFCSFFFLIFVIFLFLLSSCAKCGIFLYKLKAMRDWSILFT